MGANPRYSDERVRLDYTPSLPGIDRSGYGDERRQRLLEQLKRQEAIKDSIEEDLAYKVFANNMASIVHRMPGLELLGGSNTLPSLQEVRERPRMNFTNQDKSIMESIKSTPERAVTSGVATAATVGENMAEQGKTFQKRIEKSGIPDPKIPNIGSRITDTIKSSWNWFKDNITVGLEDKDGQKEQGQVTSPTTTTSIGVALPSSAKANEVSLLPSKQELKSQAQKKENVENEQIQVESITNPIKQQLSSLLGEDVKPTDITSKGILAIINRDFDNLPEELKGSKSLLEKWADDNEKLINDAVSSLDKMKDIKREDIAIDDRLKLQDESSEEYYLRTGKVAEGDTWSPEESHKMMRYDEGMKRAGSILEQRRFHNDYVANIGDIKDKKFKKRIRINSKSLAALEKINDKRGQNINMMLMASIFLPEYASAISQAHNEYDKFDNALGQRAKYQYELDRVKLDLATAKTIEERERLGLEELKMTKALSAIENDLKYYTARNGLLNESFNIPANVLNALSASQHIALSNYNFSAQRAVASIRDPELKAQHDKNIQDMYSKALNSAIKEVGIKYKGMFSIGTNGEVIINSLATPEIIAEFQDALARQLQNLSFESAYKTISMSGVPNIIHNAEGKGYIFYDGSRWYNLNKELLEDEKSMKIIQDIIQRTGIR